MQPVVTALIGLGYWGPNLLRNFNAQPLCKLKYGCDLKDENIQKIRVHYPSVNFTKNLDDVLADPEVELVLIATPTSTHFPLASKALRAGKHVFIEKPICASSAEAKTLLTIAKEENRMIFVDHTFAFAPSVSKLREFVDNDTLGQLLYFDSSRVNLGIIQPDTNVLWDLAIHDLTILSVIKNLKDVVEVSAHGSQYYGKHAEVAHMHIRFSDGFMAHIHVSWLSPVKIRYTMLAGTKAMVTYDDIEPSEKIRHYDKGVVVAPERASPFQPTYRAGDVFIPALSTKETLALEAEHVLDCIRHHKEPIVSGDSGYTLLTILEAADKSMASDCCIPFSHS